MRLAGLACALMLLHVLPSRCLAQGVTANIVGTVKDPQGALVAGATVKATNTATGITQTAKADGQAEYRLGNLQVGSYMLEVSAPGFQRFQQTNITLSVDQTQTIDVALSLGTESQTVSVSTAPPLVNTSTSEVGRTVEPAEIVGLPLVNRNVNSQISLTAGVQSNSASPTNSGTANFVSGLPSTDVVVNGSIDAGVPSVSYYLDGGVNMTQFRDYGNQLPNPDAIEEFRVETSNFSAAYGRMSGAVVTVLTHSGTDQLHASLFEFVRNTDLNAVGWGTKMNNPYHRNQFGGTIGGPIKRDKSFFFFSYGGLRQSVGTLLTGALVPTAAERMGDFSALPTASQPIDPTTGKPYVYNGTSGYIPPADQDPTAANILKQIPLANQSNGTWSGYFVGPTTNNEYLGKINQQLTSKDLLSASYFSLGLTTSASGGGNLPWSTQVTSAHQQNINISNIHTFNQNNVNQTWLTYTRVMGSRVNTPAMSLHDFGSTFTPQGPPGLPDIVVSGYFTLGNNYAGPVTGDDFYSVRDMVTTTKGRHTIDYGAEMSLDKDMQVATEENFGVFNFSTSTPGSTKNVLADFVTGKVGSMEQDTPYTSLLATWYYGFFVQDAYRLSQHLTLNLGLRYDLSTPFTEAQNQEQTFVPGQQSTVVPGAPLGLLYPGDKGVTRGIVGLRLHHISPRIGLAWDPFGDGKTAVRAGAGVFYGSPTGNEWNQGTTGQPYTVRQTFSSIASLTNVYGNPASFPNGNPFPYTFNPTSPRFLPAAAVSGIAENYQWPLTYQFNLAVERQLPYNISVTTAYVSTLTHDVPFEYDANYPVYAAGATSSQTSINSRRPYDGGALGATSIIGSGQTASYHSLQITARKRMSNHLTLNGFYVYSKSFYSADPGGVGPTSVTQNFDALYEERGLSDYDQTHMASISGLWDLDYYSGNNRFIKQLTNGWQIAPVVSLNTGLPLNITTGADNNADGNSNSDRPNRVAGQSAFLDSHRNRNAVAAMWFNKAAFVANGPGLGIGPGGADGNTPRNFLRSPGYRDIDIGIYRTFGITDRIKFQLRGEATNAFNFVSLAPPVATLSSPIVGQITAGVPNSFRQIQIGGRLNF